MSLSRNERNTLLHAIERCYQWNIWQAQMSVTPERVACFEADARTMRAEQVKVVEAHFAGT